MNQPSTVKVSEEFRIDGKGIWLVLRPSKIEGVGVFTETAVPKGGRISVWGDKGDIRLVKKPSGRRLKMCKRYCVEISQNVFCCPRFFNQMSIGWYLNHSDSPNARITDKYAVALRYIKSGEEITIDYRTLSEIPNIQ